MPASEAASRRLRHARQRTGCPTEREKDTKVYRSFVASDYTQAEAPPHNPSSCTPTVQSRASSSSSSSSHVARRSRSTPRAHPVAHPAEGCSARAYHAVPDTSLGAWVPHPRARSAQPARTSRPPARAATASAVVQVSGQVRSLPPATMSTARLVRTSSQGPTAASARSARHRRADMQSHRARHAVPATPRAQSARRRASRVPPARVHQTEGRAATAPLASTLRRAGPSAPTARLADRRRVPPPRRVSHVQPARAHLPGGPVPAATRAGSPAAQDKRHASTARPAHMLRRRA